MILTDDIFFSRTNFHGRVLHFFPKKTKGAGAGAGF